MSRFIVKNTVTMKFIADVMLGTLAKRLRLLGFDVLYDRNFDDNDIIWLSLEQRRLILTRDLVLAKRPLASNHLFIKSELLNEQIDQILSSASLRREANALSRCSVCNTVLKPIRKEEARDLVPEYVYKTQRNFFRCPECRRIYWKGSHVQKMDLRKSGK